jgi:uncharacterized protein YxjI
MTIPKLFQRDTIIVNEKVQFLKWGNTYLLQSDQGDEIGKVIENVPTWAKIARLIISKSILPFELNIQDDSERIIAKVSRDFTFWFSKVKVQDESGKLIGTIRHKFKLLGVKFDIIDEDNNLVAIIEGNWTAWNFVIKDTNGMEIGRIDKKWAGAVKEFFTSADRYKVEINPSVAEDENKILILSISIAIDMILKESN